MSQPSSEKLKMFDPRCGHPAFRIDCVDLQSLRNVMRVNCFTVLWIRKGSGTFNVDLHSHDFEAPAVLFGNPYQRIVLSGSAPVQATRVSFHANFFCIETYHEEVGCNGVLFNDMYGSPVLHVPKDRVHEIEAIFLAMQKEAAIAELAQSELLVSYLKVFLIKATRLKLQGQRCSPAKSNPSIRVLERLIELIEIHYRDQHSPSAYATQLGISEKALNRLVKTHFGKTLTLLLRERILKHAKWHLLHTRKPVKEIAAEVGYADELYFSRLFKRSTGLAPRAFREFEMAIRGGGNLSM